MRSRIIDKSDAETAGRWDFPAVDSTAADALRGAAKGGAHVLTAGQIEALERKVKEEARQRGYDEGLAAGKVEANARIARLDRARGRVHASVLRLSSKRVEDEIVGPRDSARLSPRAARDRARSGAAACGGRATAWPCSPRTFAT